MLAWERLHVLARNPIPPASSDNSLSASFPPSRCRRSRHSYPGGPILGLDLPPFSTPPPLGEDRRARGATGSGSGSLYRCEVVASFSIVVVRLSSSMDREILRSQPDGFQQFYVCTTPIRLSPRLNAGTFHRRQAPP